MYIDTLSPLRVAMNGRIRQSRPWHSGRCLPVNLLILVTKGDMILQIGDEQYSAQAGDALLIPANVKYIPLEARELEYLFFHFDAPQSSPPKQNVARASRNNALGPGEYAYTYSPDAPSVIHLPIKTLGSEIGRIRELTDRLSRLDPLGSDSDKLFLDCYFRELLLLLSRSSQTGISRNLSQILGYIEKNHSAEINLSSLSNSFGFSRSYIARLFKNELGMTSADYINKVRISIACELLCSSDLRMSEISRRAGFSEQYYFSRVFRRHCGMSPTEFRCMNSSMQP